MAKLPSKPSNPDYQCPECKKYLACQFNLDRHMNSAHFTLKRYFCGFSGCSYNRPEKSNTIRHMKTKHPGYLPVPVCVDRGALLAELTSSSTRSSASSSRIPSRSTSVSADSSTRANLGYDPSGSTSSVSAPVTRSGTPAPAALPRNSSAPAAPRTRASRASPYQKLYANRMLAEARHSMPEVASDAQVHPLARAVSYKGYPVHPEPDPIQALGPPDDLYTQSAPPTPPQQQEEMKPYTAMVLQRTQAASFNGYNWADAAALPPSAPLALAQQPDPAYQYNYAPTQSAPQVQLPGIQQAQVAPAVLAPIAVPPVQQPEPVYHYAPTHSAPQMLLQQAHVAPAVPPPALAQQYYYAPAESIPQQPLPASQQPHVAAAPPMVPPPLDLSGLPHWAHSAGGVSQQPAGTHVPQTDVTSPVARIARRPVSSRRVAQPAVSIAQPAASAPISVAQPVISAPSSSAPPAESSPSSSALPASPPPSAIVQPTSEPPSDIVQPELSQSDIVQSSPSSGSTAEFESLFDTPVDMSQWSPETLALYQEILQTNMPDWNDYLQTLDTPFAT